MVTTARLSSAAKRFIVLKKEVLAAANSLALCISTGAAREALDAARTLATIAGELKPPQCAEVIFALWQLPAQGRKGATKNVLTVFRRMPHTIPEAARQQFFQAAADALVTSDPEIFRLAAELVISRAAQVPPEILVTILPIAARALGRRTFPPDATNVRVRALKLLFHVQLHHTKQAAQNASTLGITVILKMMHHANDEIRKMANAALIGLAPVLNALMNEEVTAQFKQIILCDGTRLGAKRAKRTETARSVVFRALNDADGIFPTLALALLEVMTQDQSAGMFIVRLVERQFCPCWSHAGMSIGYAPPFAEMWPRLRAGLLTSDDFTPHYSAKILISYGPEARGALRELVKMFKEHHEDCFNSSPLLWAILNVGTGTQTPANILAWVRKQERTCPHAVELEYLWRKRRPKPRRRFCFTKPRTKRKRD